MSLITNIQITSSSGTVTADIGAEAANVSFETPVVIDGTSCSTLDEVVTALNTKKLNLSLKGAANGVAELDANGKVPSSQLPSYVDDVIEGYYNETDGKFYEESTYTTEITGEAGKIYISRDTAKTYRWSGSVFIVIAGDLALGETSSTAYRGDRGKTAYDHSQDANKVTTATAVGLYKVGATAEGHISGLTPIAKSDITGLGIPDASKVASFDGTTLKFDLTS